MKLLTYFNMISKSSSYAIHNKSLYPTSWYVIPRWIKPSGSRILQVVAHSLLVAIGSIAFIYMLGQRRCIITPSQQLLFSGIDVKYDEQTQTATKTCKLLASNSDEVDIMKLLTYFNNMTSKSSLYSVHNKSLHFISWYVVTKFLVAFWNPSGRLLEALW